MPDLSDFEFADINQWKHQVLEDLGIKDIEQIDRIQLSEAITQSPYVDFTSNVEDRLLCHYRNAAVKPKHNRPGYRVWQNLEYIPTSSPPENSNKLALEALKGGADGIIFEITGDTNFQKLFKDIALADCYLGLQGPYASFGHFYQYLATNQPRLKGFARIDNLVEVLGHNPDEIISALEIGAQFKNLVLKDTSSRQSGTLYEIARLLSQGVYVLDALSDAGVALPLILQNIQFNLSMSNHYLWDICRLRSLRILFHQVLTRFGSDADTASITIHAYTSDPLSASDVPSEPDHSSWQLISNTTQAMAAILGGCDMLTVLPGNADGIDTATARRIARNVSSILREESYFHMAADPVAGSYYLEDLTGKMLQNIWSRFRELESAGGYRFLTPQV